MIPFLQISTRVYCVDVPHNGYLAILHKHRHYLYEIPNVKTPVYSFIVSNIG
jgi:hypothetical protein